MIIIEVCCITDLKGQKPGKKLLHHLSELSKQLLLRQAYDWLGGTASVLHSLYNYTAGIPAKTWHIRSHTAALLHNCGENSIRCQPEAPPLPMMTRRLPLFLTVILKTILIETFQGRRRCRGCSWRWGRGSSSWGGGEQTDTALFFFLHIVVHKSVSQPPTCTYHYVFMVVFGSYSFLAVKSGISLPHMVECPFPSPQYSEASLLIQFLHFFTEGGFFNFVRLSNWRQKLKCQFLK